MTELPAMKPREVEQVLLKTGFTFARQKGSHRMYIKGIHKVVIPYHTRDLKKGTLRNILKQANLSPEEFSRLV